MDVQNSRLSRVNLDDVMEEMENEDEYGSSEEESGSSEESETDDDSEDCLTLTEESGESEYEDDNIIPSTSASPTKKKSVKVEEMDSSDNEDVERCPICLSRLDRQDIGSPESCDHNFCLDCILEWSKNVNTCPVDRKVFHLVLASHCDSDEVYKRVPVAAPAAAPDVPDEGEDRTYCEVCGLHNREDRMLLCDACDLGYHCECLRPAVITIPVGAWFCPTCTGVLGDEAETVEEQMMDRGRPQRQIARTLVSERVRANIARSRATRGRRIIYSDEESEEEEEEEEDMSYLGPVMEVVAALSASAEARARDGPSAPAAPRRTVTRRKKRTYRRRKRTSKKGTTRKAKTEGGAPVKKRRRRTKKRRKKGRRMARVKRDVPTTVKSRLAGRLGLSKPPVGRTIPMVKERVERSMEWQKSDAGLKTLSIMGHKDDLDPFSDWSEDEHMPGYRTPGAAHVSSQIAKLSRAAVQSYSVIPPSRAKSSPAKTSKSKPVAKVTTNQVSQGGGSSAFDLLGSIMQSQDVLALKGNNITIKRDGSLSVNQSTKTKTKASVPISKSGLSSDMSRKKSLPHSACGGKTADKTETYSTSYKRAYELLQTSRDAGIKVAKPNTSDRVKGGSSSAAAPRDNDKVNSGKDNIQDGDSDNDNEAIGGGGADGAGGNNANEGYEGDNDNANAEDNNNNDNSNDNNDNGDNNDGGGEDGDESGDAGDNGEGEDNDGDKDEGDNPDEDEEEEEEIIEEIEEEIEVTDDEEEEEDGECKDDDEENQEKVEGNADKGEGNVEGEENEDAADEGSQSDKDVDKEMEDGELEKSLDGGEENEQSQEEGEAIERSKEGEEMEQSQGEGEEIERSRREGEEVKQGQEEQAAEGDEEEDDDEMEEIIEEIEEEVEVTDDDEDEEDPNADEGKGENEGTEADCAKDQEVGKDAELTEVAAVAEENQNEPEEIRENLDEEDDVDNVMVIEPTSGAEDEEQNENDDNNNISHNSSRELAAKSNEDGASDTEDRRDMDGEGPGSPISSKGSDKRERAIYEDVTEESQEQPTDEQAAEEGERSFLSTDTDEEMGRPNMGPENPSQVPISELPRIPKKKRRRKERENREEQEEEEEEVEHEHEQEEDDDVQYIRSEYKNHPGVLQRLDNSKRDDQQRRRDRRRRHRRGEEEVENEAANVEEDESERRHRHGRRTYREKRESSSRDRDLSDNSHSPRRRRRRSRSRSREHRRERVRRSKSREEPRSREREHRQRSRERSSGSRERNRRDRRRRRRRSRTKSRSRSRNRSRTDRETRREQHADDFKGSVKMFSQSLKDVSDPEAKSSRRFRLKRNSAPAEPPESKRNRYEEEPPSERQDFNYAREEKREDRRARRDERREDRRVEERRTEDRRVEERRPEERRVEERRTDDRRVEERRTEDRRVEERRTDRTEDRRVEERRVEDRGERNWEEYRDRERRDSRERPIESVVVTSGNSVKNIKIHKRVGGPFNRKPGSIVFKIPEPPNKLPKSKAFIDLTVDEAEQAGTPTPPPSPEGGDSEYDPTKPTEDASPTRSEPNNPPEPATPEPEGDGEMDEDKTESSDMPSEASAPDFKHQTPSQQAVTALAMAIKNVNPGKMANQGGEAQSDNTSLPKTDLPSNTLPRLEPGSQLMPPMRLGMMPQNLQSALRGPLMLNQPMLLNGPPPHIRGVPRFAGIRPAWPPNVIPLHSGVQNGMPPGAEGLRPGGPLPPPPPPLSLGVNNSMDLNAPPAPITAKALAEMEHLSQLLNAQSKTLAKVAAAQANKTQMNDSENMEVIDMDVASPLSDDDFVLSFSPPPLKDSRDKSGQDEKMNKAIRDAQKEADSLPTSAVELDKHQKYMKKLNRQERVVEEVKLAIKPHYASGKINKSEYKEILRKSVPKICHSKSGDINPVKIRGLVDAYVEKVRKTRKYVAKKGLTKANGVQMGKK